MRNYSFEKGKFGGAVGTIYPFVVELNGKDPASADWKTKIPAGFLRCDGSVVNGDLYPTLKQVLGVGSDSLYRKSSIILQEANANGSGGQFQLPDLGSKYIRASAQSGTYSATVNNNTVGVQNRRVGVATELTSNLGTGNTVTADMVYQGNTAGSTGFFTVPGRPVAFSGNFSITINGATSIQTVPNDTFLPHAHFSNTASIEDPTIKIVSGNADTGGGYSGKDVWGVQSATSIVPSTGLTLNDTAHDHIIERTNPTRSITGNIPQFNVSAENIITSVSLRIDDTEVMNDLQLPFVLVEYLIKY